MPTVHARYALLTKRHAELLATLFTIAQESEGWVASLAAKAIEIDTKIKGQYD